MCVDVSLFLVSDIEFEMHNISIFYNIVFTLLHVFTCCLHCSFRTVLLQVGKLLRVRCDKPTFEVSVDHSRCLGRLCCVLVKSWLIKEIDKVKKKKTYAHGPGSHFLLSAGIVMDKIQRLVTSQDDAG